MTYGIWDKKEGVVALIKDDLVTYYKKIEGPLPGSIYRAYIGKRLSFLNANEVSLGDEEALLFDKDKLGPSKGQVLVAYKAPGYAGKKPSVTEKIILKGTYLILDPNSKGVSISKKIRDKDLRDDFIQEFKDRKYGLIVRTQAQGNISKALEEYKDLEGQMDKILASKDFKPCPSLVYEAKDRLYESLGQAEKIYTNDLALYKNDDFTSVEYNMKFSYLDDPILARNLEMKKSRKIDLAGAEIVIDELEALVVIDINSKSIKQGANKIQNAHYVNRLVIEGILSQLALRNIGGIVLIDFIRTNKEKMEEIRKEILSLAPSFRLDISSISYTRAGLLEIVIKR